MKKQNITQRDQVDFPIFLISVMACSCFYLPMVIFSETANEVIPAIMNRITNDLDWCFELVAFGCVVFSLWLIFGKYGKVRLGGEEAKPEFSTFSWIAMIFCAGVGAGIIYWACIESILYISNPPFGITPQSSEARKWALTYTCFHWSITPWAIYAIPAVTFAYKFFNRNCGGLRASYACSGALGKKSEGIVGNIIDIFVIIGLLGGLATSLGFVFPMLSGLVAEHLGISDTILLQMYVGFFFTCVVGYSCIRGLYSGIAKLSNLNMVLFILMILFILLSGPTLWMISFFTESVGNMLQNFIHMSFYVDSVSNDGFAQFWTVFYWAWQISWSVYIGLFAARISKGRTIRFFVVSIIFVAGGGTAAICAVLGSYTQHVIFDLGIDLIGIAQSAGNIKAIYTMLLTLPFAKGFIPIFVMILLIAQATGIDSAAYTLSNISCKKVGGEGEPPLWIRVFWVLAIFFSAVVLILVGGMEAVKISSVLTSVPLLVLMLIFILSLSHWLKEDFNNK